MVRTIGKNRVLASLSDAAAFFGQQCVNQGDHVRVALKMRRLFKAAIGVFANVPQMGKVDAIGKLPGDGRHVIGRVRP